MSTDNRLLLRSMAILLMVAVGSAQAQETSPTSQQAISTAPVEAFDLEAFIAELNPPTVEEIIKSLKPIPTLEECLAPERDTPNVEARSQTQLLDKQIKQLRRLGKYGEAMLLAQQVVRMRACVQDADHWQVKDAQRLVTMLQRYSKVLPADASVVRSIERADDRADWLYEQGRYRDGANLAMHQIPIRRRILGYDSAQMARCVNDLAAMLEAMGDYENALLLFRESLTIRQRVLGTMHPDFAEGLNNLANNLENHGDYDRAKLLCQLALVRFRQTFGEEHSRVALAMHNLGSILYKLGDWGAASVLLHQALVRRREALGDTHPRVASTLFNLGFILLESGDLIGAEPFLREALAIERKSFGERHWKVARSLEHLASLESARGNAPTAAMLYAESAESYMALFGETHFNVAQVLLELADSRFTVGRTSEASQAAKRAAAIIRNLPKSEKCAGLLELAKSTAHRGDLRAAMAICGEAKVFLPQMLSDSGVPRLLVPLCLPFARLYAHILVYDAYLGLSEPRNLSPSDLNLLTCCARIVIATSDILAPLPNIDIALWRQWLGRMLLLDGKYVDAERLAAAAAISFEDKRIRLVSGGLDRSQFDRRLSPYRTIAACCAKSGKSERAANALEKWFARGLIDDLSLRLLRPYMPRETMREQDILGRIVRCEEKMSVVHLLGNAVVKKFGTYWGLLRERDGHMTDLARFHSEMREKYGVLAGEVYDVRRIQERMADASAIIAWLDITSHTQAVKLNGEHWVCVIKKKGEPIWEELAGSAPDGTWTEYDGTLSERCRKEVAQRDIGNSDAWNDLALRLFRQRIAPIEAHLTDVRHLIVIPAGLMSGVPIEALTGKYLISYAPSGTVFTMLIRATEGTSGSRQKAAQPIMLAVGDPAISEARTRSSNRADNGLLGLILGRKKDPVERYLQRERGIQFDALPGSRREVGAIAKTFGRRNLPVAVLLGSDASEQNLHRLATAGELKKFRYLHLATHGVMDDKLSMNSALILAQDDLPDVLERVLAREEVYDGRLTADQIVRTWKLDADLVTLSGCQTALGKRVGGEGFLGFSQALFVAGARSVVLSLWNVDDVSTSILMEEFYGNLLEKKRTKARALLEAKRTLREMTWKELEHRSGMNKEQFAEYANTRGGFGKAVAPKGDLQPPYAHPYYWAAFILIGDPG